MVESDTTFDDDASDRDSGVQEQPSNRLLYSLEDRPPLGRSVFFAVQHVLTLFGAMVAVPLLLGSAMNMSRPELGQLISCVMLSGGVATILQVSLGSRLPIVQGMSFSFLGAFFGIIAAGKEPGWSSAETMQYIAGAILAGAVVEIFIGATGLVGWLKRFVSPVVIGPVIILIGLSLFKHGAPQAAMCLPIGGLTVVLLVAFSLVLSRRSAFLKMFPVLSAVVCVVALCWLLSMSDVFPGPGIDKEGAPIAAHPAHVDFSAVEEAPWVRGEISRVVFPWGWPKFSLAFFLAVVAAYVTSILESFGDYHACSYLCGAGEPTDRQISRGITAEGVGCLVTSVFGGFATTSYSENIGVIGLTRTGSRYVVLLAGGLLVLLGIFGKFGALAAAIPAPVVGGLYCVLFGLIAAVGIQQLGRADLTSNRNLFIVGFSLFMGLSVPAYFDGSTSDIYSPGSAELLAGLPTWLGDIVKSIGSTGMAVAAVCGLLLDNLVPQESTRESR